MDTSDEWIRQRSGIRERRYVAEGQGPTDLALAASKAALEMADLSASDLDFIIVATQTPEAFFPGTGCFLQKALDVHGCGALDVHDQCTGFLYGLSIADSYIRLGKYRRVLLVGTEVHSTGLDFSNDGRAITVLFGDGAGAMILGPAVDDSGSDVLSTELHADGLFVHDLWTPGPSSTCAPRISHEMLDEGMQFPQMNGQSVFKQATTRLVSVVQEVLQANGLQADDVDYFVPHQANRRINDLVVKKIGYDPEKVDHSIERYGNCAAASVPLAFDECVRDGRVKRGDLVMFATFAAGFTWGASLLRF
jgi:3-oxoacyl-[acyl-carrier-protein] synthase-3